MRTHADILEAIHRHGIETYPEECCGFLLGRLEVEEGRARNQVEEALRAENVRSAARETRYLISPDDVLRAEREARARDQDLVGFYHSHPDHPARPSATDLAEAAFPGYSYVIVSIVGGRPTELTAWSLRPDRSGFEADPIELIS